MNLSAFCKEELRRKNASGTIYTTCPVCRKTNKFGITQQDSHILYHCFSASCGIKGSIKLSLSKESMQQILKGKYYHEEIKRAFEVPVHWVQGFATEEAYRFALRYELLSPYSLKAFQTSTDLRYNRQVFFYTDDSYIICGAQGRALKRGMKKSYIYPNSVKTPWVIGETKVAVVVEDCLSAIKAFNVGFTGIALSGTDVQDDWINYFKGYDKIYVALDKDATTKSFGIKKLLDIFCNCVIIVPLQVDLKDMTNEQALKTINKQG